MEKYFKKFKKFKIENPDTTYAYKRPISIYTQKGCRWREISNRGCIFCSRMESHLRVREPKRIVREIEHLIKDYKIDCLREFSDDFMGAGHLWMKEFESAYQRIKNKPLMGICVRADRITPESA